MMLRINVAPESKVETKVGDLAPALAITAVTCLVAYYLPVLYASSVTGDADELKAKTADKKQQLQNLEFDLNKAKALQATLNDLKQRQDLIRSLGRSRKQPVLVLDKMQQLHLERMWLQEMGFEKEILSVKAWATDYGVVSEYVRRIRVTTGEDAEANLDARNFKPVFAISSPKKEVQTTGEYAVVVPVKFSSVMLKRSELVEIEGFPIQKFELDFNPNIEMVTIGQQELPR